MEVKFLVLIKTFEKHFLEISQELKKKKKKLFFFENDFVEQKKKKKE